MKLIYKFTLWYLLISLGVFFLGGLITYQIVKREIVKEQERFLQERLPYVTRMVHKRQPTSLFTRDKIVVEPLPNATAETPVVFSDTLVMHSTLERMEPHTKLEVVQNIKGTFYKISLFDVIVEEDDIVDSVRESMIKFYLLLMGAVLLLGIFAGWYLFKPFHATLARIKDFDLGNGQPIKQRGTSTKEFAKLNQFLHTMTSKVQNDYQALKEFSENASHEMQTPLANAIGKLELILSTGKLPDAESIKVLASLDSLRHLSKMGQSLGLLTKIENLEFQKVESVNFSELLQQSLDNFQELMDLKSLTLESSIAPEIQITMDNTLARILVNNLISNAIRHNHEKGKIRTKLEARRFIICNSGPPLTVAPETMFDRFKKDRQAKEGLGLGLAIVKKICDVTGFEIQYECELDEHRIEILF